MGDEKDAILLLRNSVVLCEDFLSPEECSSLVASAGTPHQTLSKSLMGEAKFQNRIELPFLSDSAQRLSNAILKERMLTLLETK